MRPIGARSLVEEKAASRDPGGSVLSVRSVRRRGMLAAWALLLGTTAVAVAETRILSCEIASSVLGRTLPITVIAPADTPRERAPVLFFLHGRGRHHRSLIESESARTALLAAPFYVVLPQGEDGWYIDSPARPADRYGAYLQEVVAWAERQFPVGGASRQRGITGWSMGGYGAVRVAQASPGQFGFVASVIGLLDFPRAETLPTGQNYRVPVNRFTADPAVWAAHNPLHAVDTLRGSALTLVLASRGFELTMNERFLAQLAERQLPVRVHRLEGGHEFALVERAVPLVLADAAAFFSLPYPSP